MKTLNEIAENPSGLDSYANYFGDKPSSELLVVLTKSRDSDTLTESNWQVAIDRLGGESDAVEIHRFGHWACGWWEALCVAKGSTSEQVGQDIEDSIESYPILDEGHLSELEEAEANDMWESMNWKDRVEHLRNNSYDYSFSDLIEYVRGNYGAPFTNNGYEGLLSY